MNLVSISNRWLSRLYKTFAIMLVFIAVLISALRLTLPYVDNYKTHLEDFINERNNINVSIGELDMSWRNMGPVLIAKNVQLLESESADVYIQELDLQINVWKSLTRQELISNRLIIKGAKIFIDERLWKPIVDVSSTDKNTVTDNSAVNGQSTALTQIQSQTESTDEFAFDQIANLFLNSIASFSIFDSEVEIGKEKQRSFNIVRIRWLNDGDTHKAQGRVIFDKVSDTQVKLSINLNGDTANNLTGGVYLHANKLDITPWLDQFLAVENDKSTSSISFDAWAKIINSEVDRVQVEFHENKISWHSPKPQTLQLLPAQLLFVQNPNKDGFKFFSTNLALKMNTNEAEPFHLFINKQQDKITGYLSSVDMTAVSHILPLFVKDKSLRDVFSTLSASGHIENIFLFKQDDDFIIDASLADISTEYSGGIPGVKNINGHLNFYKNSLHIDLSSKKGVIDFQDRFVLPIPYDELSIKSEVEFNESGWKLAIHDVSVTSPELTLSGSLQVDAPNDSESTMALLMGVVKGDASLAEHYYPLKLMSESLFNYLDGALVDGDLTQATILFNGPFSHFPFEDDAGIFVVDAEIDNGTFQFADNWAPITQFNANLNFTNEGMLITGRGGKLVGVSVKGVEVGIASLADEQVLTVSSLIHPIKAREMTLLMQQSPYKTSVGEVLETLNVGDKINGKFHLNLPLNDIDKAVAQGEINFKNNSVALQKPRIDFTKLNGKLLFNNDKITTKNLTLHYANLPLKINVNAFNKSDYYNTNIKIDAKWQDKLWLKKIPSQLKKYAKGQFDWQGDLSLYQHKDGGFSYHVDVNSTLNGMTLDLPIPYEKHSKTSVPFSLKSRGGITKSTIDLKVGEQFNFFGELKHATTSFSKAHLVLGNDAMLLPMDGFHITTKLEKANASQWLSLITDVVDSVSTDTNNAKKTNLVKNTSQTTELISKPLLAAPKRVRGRVDELSILGQTLHNASFNFLDKDKWWLLQLNAKETRSRIKIFSDWQKDGMAINADFIHIDDESKKTTEKDGDTGVKVVNEDKTLHSKIKNADIQSTFDSIPKIEFYCARCQINALQLGEVKFTIDRKNKNELQINGFVAQRSDAKLLLEGAWNLQAGVSSTAVTGDLSIDSIEHELKALDFGSIIRDSGAKIKFDFNWPSTPDDFSINQLDGKFNMVVDDGYLAHVPDKAKVFSVLSLDSLLRKLTLDFRDIFSDGMFYSSITGDYNLEEGLLHTQNTKLNGTAGDLILTGSTDLNQGSLDYKMSYKPNLTSSLPVLAWVATSLNPAVFLGAIALDRIITANVVSEFKFELKGSIDDPQLIEIDRKSKNVSVDSSKDTPSEPPTNPSEKSSFKQGNGA